MIEENKIQDNDRNEEDQEIDLLELGFKLWDGRKRVLIWGLWGAVLGLIIAFSIPKEYTASMKIVPESGEAKSGGNLSALAAFAGISMSNAGGDDAVYPGLYPSVVASVPFAIELFNVVLPTDIEGKDSLTLAEIITEETSKPWWSSIMGMPGKMMGGIRSIFNKSNDETIYKVELDPFRLTPFQREVVEAINNRVTADLENKTSVLTISVMLQDPLAAASLADTVTRKLQDYIVQYRTGKVRNDLAYAKKINEEAKAAYYEAQQQYARYTDRNQGLVNRSAAIEQERLQNEMQLAFNLYNSTAQQVQLAEAKVQSNTPVFTVVEPSTVPLQASKPRKKIIFIGCIFLAIVAAAAYTLFAPGIISTINDKKNQIINSEKP